MPSGDMEVHLHDEHHQVLQFEVEEEAQGANRAPFPQGNYVITVEVKRYKRSERNGTISGCYDLTPEEPKENAWDGEMKGCYDI